MTPSRMDVLGLGESSVDYVYVVDELPVAGASKVRIAARYTACGGQVATTMASCAALGLAAAYLGPVGEDENGRRVLEELRRHGVDTSKVMTRPAPNRYAVILVDARTGERHVLWGRDPALDLEPASLAADALTGARLVHIDATDEAAALAMARMARSAGAVVTCDLDAVTPHTVELLSHVTAPVLAEHLPQALTGISDVERALRALREGHSGLLCVTLGERGSAALDGERFVHMPAFAVRAVDTTAAGDVFRAGFIFGLLNGWPTQRTLRFANAAAAVSCTRRGAMDSVPALADVERLLR